MHDDITIHALGNLTERETEECLRVIKEGGAVSMTSAIKEFPEAATVAIKRRGGLIVGVGVIKKRRPDYASKITERSGFPFDRNMDELGYVAISADQRGKKFSREIVVGLLSASSGQALFATTSSEPMKRTLRGAGFIEKGHDWTGKSGATLSLWIKYPNLST